MICPFVAGARAERQDQGADRRAGGGCAEADTVEPTAQRRALGSVGLVPGDDQRNRRSEVVLEEAKRAEIDLS